MCSDLTYNAVLNEEKTSKSLQVGDLLGATVLDSHLETVSRPLRP
jgi:hypothetical protein